MNRKRSIVGTEYLGGDGSAYVDAPAVAGDLPRIHFRVHPDAKAQSRQTAAMLGKSEAELLRDALRPCYRSCERMLRDMAKSNGWTYQRLEEQLESRYGGQIKRYPLDDSLQRERAILTYFKTNGIMLVVNVYGGGSREIKL